MPAEAPWEWLEMVDGAVMEFTVLRAEEGTAVFTRARDNVARESQMLRLHVSPSEKRTLPPYWDTNAQLLLATLRPMLLAEGALPRRIRLRKYGEGPSGRYGLEDLGRQTVV